MTKVEPNSQQIALFEVPLIKEVDIKQVKTYANDEIANALKFIPKSVQFQTLDDFKAFLMDELPYNAASTRQRRANYLIDRFYPNGRIDTLLTKFLSYCSSQECLKPTLFYQVLKAEPLIASVAEDFVMSALPVGYIEREALRKFILQKLPKLGASSQKNVLRSILTTYDLLGVGSVDKSVLRFGLSTGNIESFLYILVTEFSQPGTYTFQDLEQGVMYHWLLWHRDWMKQQLYQLREIGIISKISEIDTVRQFTLELDPVAALDLYFSQPK